jgi:hypothetical protein
VKAGKIAGCGLGEPLQSTVHNLRAARRITIVQFDHDGIKSIPPVASFEDFFFRTLNVDLEQVDMINAEVSY